MSITLKLKGRRKEWKIGKEGVRGEVRARIDHSLREVFNLTFTDYCSLRTKRKLDNTRSEPFRDQ